MDLYPPIDDPKFQFLLSRKLEFRNLENVDGLYPHQEFVRRFLSPYTPYKSLLLFHHLGSGKSIACIATAVDHYLYDGKRCIILTKGQSGTDNFLKQIKRFHSMSSKKDKWDESIFMMRHYMSLSNWINKHPNEHDKIANAYSNKIIVFDEVHNVRDINRDASTVYSSIITMLQLCVNTKIILATATPMTDSDSQLSSIVHMCHMGKPRECASLLSGIVSYNPFVADKPSYAYIGDDTVVPNMRVYTSYMMGHQERSYRTELQKYEVTDIYRSLTHIALFCFEDGTYGRRSNKMFYTRHHTNIIPTPTPSEINFRTKELKYVQYAVKREFAHLLSGDGLRMSSCKYSALMDVLNNTDGNVFVFIEEVQGSGLLLLACILEAHGYELYTGKDLRRIPPKKRYTFCVGSLDLSPNNIDRLNGFNSELNVNGEYVRVLLGSKVIGESITLLNVRQFHFMTPHWNESTVNQAVGRVVRNGSHNALAPSNRHVDIYVHAAIFSAMPEKSIDIKKLVVCKHKQTQIQRMEQRMMEEAVDRYCIENTSSPKNKSKIYFDCKTFAAAYIDLCLDKFTANISDAMKSHDICTIDDLSVLLDIHPFLCKEAVCRIIHDNIPLSNRCYLRAYGNSVFAVKDLALPYVTLAKDYIYNMEQIHTHISLPTQKIHDGTEVIQSFRFMPVKQKVEYFEQCVLEDRRDILYHMPTLYATIDNVIYHLLNYRDLESAYTSSNPVPRRCEGKTRYFKDGAWHNLGTHEERQVFSVYNALIQNFVAVADEKPLFGIISTIDGDMRLRMRNLENASLSYKDSRYVKRGKSLKSIKKQELVAICNGITNKSGNYETMNIADIIEHLDTEIIAMGLYAII